MEDDWMGRYRPLIMAITEHGALVTSEEKNRKKDMGDGIFISIQEWMVLVNIVEHRKANLNMNQLVEVTHIPQSTFSKQVKLLCSYGLVEKSQMVDNKKNVVLQPTERGMEYYNKHAAAIRSAMFSSFFDTLKDVSTEDLDRFTQALNALNADMCPEFVARYSSKITPVRK